MYDYNIDEDYFDDIVGSIEGQPKEKKNEAVVSYAELMFLFSLGVFSFKARSIFWHKEMFQTEEEIIYLLSHHNKIDELYYKNNKWIIRREEE
jgi:hypothetical protein